MKKPPLSAPLVLAAVACGLSGCPTEEKAFEVKGSLKENGGPVQMATTGLPPGVKGIDVAFHVLKDGAPTGEFHTAVVEDDGSFTVPGPKGKGLSAGKYRISVLVASGTGKPSSGGAGGGGSVPPGTEPPGTNTLPPYEGSLSGLPDRLKGAIGRDKSPLNVDIDGPANFLVEIGKSPKVSKQ